MTDAAESHINNNKTIRKYKRLVKISKKSHNVIGLQF